MGLLIGLGAWLVHFVELIRAVLYPTPDAYRHRYVWWNWFNALPRREFFTEEWVIGKWSHLSG